jgi:hypothetical protein
VAIDEELTLLDDYVRRLKIEYDVYFGGGSKKLGKKIIGKRDKKKQQ